jgi:hydroxyacylglutathione hydrolase
MLFSGDTLFSIGCGRFFEGSPEDMQLAMDKLAQLNPATQVYCGHEYTRANCAFALQLEPDNAALQARTAQVEALRARQEITLPATLSNELAANPFLRTRAPAVVAAAQQRDPNATPGAGVMGVIRAWKDSF